MTTYSFSDRYTHLKIAKLRFGGVAQVKEHLLCKWKALSSNPSPIKKVKKKPPRKTR
jgi:hypothetical protein